MTERARPNNKKSSYVEGAAPESSQKDTFWDSENDTSHTCYVLVLTRFTRCSRALHTHYHLHPVPEYWCVEESVAQAMRLARVTTTLRGARYTHMEEGAIGLTDALPRNGRSPCVHVHHTRLGFEGLIGLVTLLGRRVSVCESIQGLVVVCTTNGSSLSSDAIPDELSSSRPPPCASVPTLDREWPSKLT